MTFTIVETITAHIDCDFVTLGFDNYSKNLLTIRIQVNISP